MLSDNGISYTYREYTKEPFTRDELVVILNKLGMEPKDVLRSRDAKKAGLTGSESKEELIGLMVENPRLVQRPIGVVGDSAVVGRPPELLLDLV